MKTYLKTINKPISGSPVGTFLSNTICWNIQIHRC